MDPKISTNKTMTSGLKTRKMSIRDEKQETKTTPQTVAIEVPSKETTPTPSNSTDSKDEEPKEEPKKKQGSKKKFGPGLKLKKKPKGIRFVYI